MSAERLIQITKIRCFGKADMQRQTAEFKLRAWKMTSLASLELRIKLGVCLNRHAGPDPALKKASRLR
jgi:hypothetical protein